MLDASLTHPFFSRDANGKIIGMDSGVEWHNESKGVFMINQYFKQQRDYDKIIRKLGKKIIKLEDDLDNAEDELLE